MKRFAFIPALAIALSLTIGACSEPATEEVTPETEVAPETEPVTPETEAVPETEEAE